MPNSKPDKCPHCGKRAMPRNTPREQGHGKRSGGLAEMSVRIAARVQACLRGFWQRQTARAETRRVQLAASLERSLPKHRIARRFPNQLGIPPTFETPRTHHTHTELKEARRAQ